MTRGCESPLARKQNGWCPALERAVGDSSVSERASAAILSHIAKDTNHNLSRISCNAAEKSVLHAQRRHPLPTPRHNTHRTQPMTAAMYTHSVPVFKQMLTALKTILAQASEHAAAKSIEPDAFLQARLAPDMFPLLRQVQIAADFSRGIAARLAGVEVPTFAGQEKSFADLDALLAQTLAFLDSVDAAQFEGKESAEIVLRPGTPKEKKLSGQAYLANYGLPQFFFHVTTAYDILRHNGLPIGKRDFMGAY